MKSSLYQEQIDNIEDIILDNYVRLFEAVRKCKPDRDRRSYWSTYRTTRMADPEYRQRKTQTALKNQANRKEYYREYYKAKIQNNPLKMQRRRDTANRQKQGKSIG